MDRNAHAPLRQRLLSWFILFLGGLYFFVPLIATIDFSLRARKGVLSALAYQRVLSDPRFASAFTFSLEMALLTVVVGVVLVVPTAYWIRLRLPQLRPVVEFITLMPFVVPAIVLVFGLIRVFSRPPFLLTTSFTGTQILLVAGYVVLVLPYLYRAVDTGLQAIDIRTLTEAAQSLGAGWWVIITQIIFPNLRSAILSGAFLTITIVMGELTMASFLVGLKAFGPYMSQVGQNRAYEGAALAVISFALTWAFTMLFQFVGRRALGGDQAFGAR